MTRKLSKLDILEFFPWMSYFPVAHICLDCKLLGTQAINALQFLYSLLSLQWSIRIRFWVLHTCRIYSEFHFLSEHRLFTWVKTIFKVKWASWSRQGTFIRLSPTLRLHFAGDWYRQAPFVSSVVFSDKGKGLRLGIILLQGRRSEST